jgi:hypothetical protein
MRFSTSANNQPLYCRVSVLKHAYTQYTQILYTVNTILLTILLTVILTGAHNIITLSRDFLAFIVLLLNII